MNENAPNLELRHSGLCRRVCRGRIFDIGFVHKVLLHTHGVFFKTVRVFLYKLALGMDENAPNLELKHSGQCQIGCRSRIFYICFLQKVLLHTHGTISPHTVNISLGSSLGSLGMDKMAPNLELKHSWPSQRVSRCKILENCTVIFFNFICTANWRVFLKGLS